MKTYTIQIMLKKGIADPQGLSTQMALIGLGFDNVKDVRIGRTITVVTEDSIEQVTEMCQKLLCNPVMEDYEITVQQ